MQYANATNRAQLVISSSSESYLQLQDTSGIRIFFILSDDALRLAQFDLLSFCPPPSMDFLSTFVFNSLSTQIITAQDFYHFKFKSL
jgi:hypothetical protein